jgi:hypothetical protein
MRGRTAIAGVAAVATIGATLVGGIGAGAVTQLEFFGYAGGSLVRALNNTVTSDLSAASAVSGPDSNATSTNTLAHLSVPDLLTADGVSTSATTRKTLTGYQVVSKAQTTGVNLLNGAITIQAVTTTATSTLANNVATSTVNTQFAGIKIVGINLPINIPKNYTVTIPNIATVNLNMSLTVTQGTTTAGTGAGLAITLLKPVGSNQAGASIFLSPVYSRLGDVDAEATGHTSRGAAYGSQVTASAGTTLVGVRSDPTAPVNVTPGKTNTTSLAAVNLSPTLQLGAITNTASGTQTTALGEAETTSKIAGLNLFNGLIKADAISVDAHVRAPTGSPVTRSGTTTLLNLVINGNAIPASVAPNTTINLLNIAIITLNQQFISANQVVVRALDIKITTDAYGLPAGAEIQLAVAGAAAT